jgi:hypothetical protein
MRGAIRSSFNKRGARVDVINRIELAVLRRNEA